MIFSFCSPRGARPGTGLAEPAERPRSERTRAQRVWSGAEADRSRAAGAAEGDCTAGTRSVERDGAWSRARAPPPVDWARARRSAAACGTKAPTYRRRGGRATAGREPPTCAARMSRNENVWYSGNGGSGMAGPSRVRSNASGGSGGGSLGRARKLGGELRCRTGGAL